MFDPSLPSVPLIPLAQLHPLLVYGGIFVAMIIEGGEAVLFSAFFLIHKGIVDPLITLPLLYAGVVLGDVLWYLATPYIASWPLLRSIVRLTSVFDPLITKRPFRAFAMTKFAYGLHHPMIVRFAILKVPLTHFLLYTSLLSLVWVVLMACIGYGVFASIAYIEHFVKFAEIGITLAIVGFFVFQRIIGAYFESLAAGKSENISTKS